MFTYFYYLLRSKKVPVSITEWMVFMEALSNGHVKNLDDFYFLARAILVKSEAYFDHFDVAFQEYFQGLESGEDINDQIWEWLKDPLNKTLYDEVQKAACDMMKLDELMKELEKRLKEQTEQHDGGNYWIGRGGTSPFGHSGYHPNGIRIGGESRGRQAVQIAAERRFQNYRNDLTLDTRQMKIALKRLRQLTRIGLPDELDLNGTIDATAKNYGELELIWERSRKNSVKVLLLMDVGGSMDPFSLLCSQLFSAAHSSSHFKDFQHYYFHNCIYDNLYTDIERNDKVSTNHILSTLTSDYKVILVGDARMAYWELSDRWGAINYYERNEVEGINWLKRIADHFTHCVWLNPDSPQYWNHNTVEWITRVFPMFPLTIDGLESAIQKLIVKR